MKLRRRNLSSWLGLCCLVVLLTASACTSQQARSSGAGSRPNIVVILSHDIGWKPEYTFKSAVEHTWDWFQAEGLHETRDFDFAFEDQLLERLGH